MRSMEKCCIVKFLKMSDDTVMVGSSGESGPSTDDVKFEEEIVTVENGKVDPASIRPPPSPARDSISTAVVLLKKELLLLLKEEAAIDQFSIIHAFCCTVQFLTIA